MDYRRAIVECPFCGHGGLDVYLETSGHECPACKGRFSVEMQVIYVAVPFTRDEAAVMIACQGMGYEAGFSEAELAIAHELLARGLLEYTDYGGKQVLNQTARGNTYLDAQRG